MFPAPSLLVQDVRLDVKAKFLGNVQHGTEFQLRTIGSYVSEDDEVLTTIDYQTGVGRKDRVQLGTKAVCVLVRWKDFGPPPSPSDPPIRNRHPLAHFMLCPKYSFFYSLFQPTILETERDKPLYDVHLEWAEGLERLSKAKEEDKGDLLGRFVQGGNPLLGMHAVHLIARLYPEKAQKNFKDWIVLPKVLPEVRLTIDYELTLKERKAWLESDVRRKWVSMLEEEDPTAMEGTNLVGFHKRVLPMWLSED